MNRGTGDVRLNGSMIEYAAKIQNENSSNNIFKRRGTEDAEKFRVFKTS